MTTTQYKLKALNLEAIQDSLAADEYIAAVGVPMVSEQEVCHNAIIIANERGEERGWFNGGVPACFIGTEEDKQEC